MCVCGACCACVEAGCCAIACCTRSVNRTVSKYVYMGLFIASTIVAWVIRDYSTDTIKKFSVFIGCDGNNKCVGVEGVLRISLGLTMFFVLMFVTTAGTVKKKDWRDSWHNSWWLLKFPIWIVFCCTPFFIHTEFFHIYAEVARGGAGLFLLLLLISVINFIYIWNDSWVENADRWWFGLVVVSLTSYGLSLAGIVLMYLWFTPTAQCGLNLFFVTFAVVQIVVITFVSLIGQVNAGLMSSGLVSLYLVYQTWTGIMSEPLSETCNTRTRFTGHDDWIVIISFILGFLAIVYSVFATGLDSKTFSLSVERGKDGEEEEEIPYGYGFFHFVFALGSMYVAMLLLGWDLSQTSAKWGLAEGWISVWVQIGASWLTTGLYLWSMLAPLIFKDREFS